MVSEHSAAPAERGEVTDAEREPDGYFEMEPKVTVSPAQVNDWNCTPSP